MEQQLVNRPENTGQKGTSAANEHLDGDAREFARGESLGFFVQETRSEQQHSFLFGKLGRYTRFVFFGKWALGGFAIVLVALLIIWPLFGNSSGTRISFVSEAGSDSSANAPQMLNPRYQSVDKKEQQYTITADLARQLSDEKVALENISAELFFLDQSWMAIRANNGRYNEVNELLDLRGEVTLTHAEGHRFITEQADINVAQATANGELLVNGEGPMGTLVATGFTIKQNGDYMFFGKKERVTVVITRDKQAKS